MDFTSYEFVSLNIESTNDAEVLDAKPRYEVMPSCDMMLEFSQDQTVDEHVPISIISNCLKQMEKKL